MSGLRVFRGLSHSFLPQQGAFCARSMSSSALFKYRSQVHREVGLWVRSFSDSVTYSGGQASAGQGGFYGSGGSRVKGAPEHRPEAQARRDDIVEARNIMEEILDMEEKLLAMGSSVTTESMTLKNDLVSS